MSKAILYITLTLLLTSLTVQQGPKPTPTDIVETCFKDLEAVYGDLKSALYDLQHLRWTAAIKDVINAYSDLKKSGDDCSKITQGAFMKWLQTHTTVQFQKCAGDLYIAYAGVKQMVTALRNENWKLFRETLVATVHQISVAIHDCQHAKP